MDRQRLSLVLPAEEPAVPTSGWVQGACWTDRTGKLEGKGLGGGENQIELAVCYTSSAQSFRGRNAEEDSIHVSVTQHLPVTGRHLDT